MNIAIGSDHRGIALKTEVINILKETGHTFHDFGYLYRKLGGLP